MKVRAVIFASAFRKLAVANMIFTSLHFGVYVLLATEIGRELNCMVGWTMWSCLPSLAAAILSLKVW